MKVVKKDLLKQTSITSFLQVSAGEIIGRKRVAHEQLTSKSNKKKRVEIFTKLEETKEEKEFNSISTAIDTITAGRSNLLPRYIAVKQEEILDGKNDPILDQPTELEDLDADSKSDDTYHDQEKEEEEFLPVEDDPNFHCRVCLRNLSTKSSYRYHLVHVHGMKVRPTEKDVMRDKIENADFLPDQFDRNNYCAVCDKEYATRCSYREHLQNVHKMTLLPYRKKSVRFPTALKPDPHDPNFYCRVCAYKYSGLTTYRIHLLSVHSVVLKPSRGPKRINPDIQPDEDDPDYCASCDRKFKSNHLYRSHLEKIHKMTLKPRPAAVVTRKPKDIVRTKRRQRDPNVDPDPNDTDFYCKSCFFTYRDKYRFYQHIRSFHKNIVLPGVVRRHSSCPRPPRPYEQTKQRLNGQKVQFNPNPSISPNPYDPNFFCASCQENLGFQHRYFTHIGIYHKEVQLPCRQGNGKHRKPRPNRDIVPDPGDKDFYCKSCDYYFTELQRYRTHLIRTHKMTLAPIKRNTVPIPFGADVNDPNNTYCFLCKFVCDNRGAYDKHMEEEHETIEYVPVNKDVVPDLENSKNHCNSCEMTFRSPVTYRDHLKKIHDMDFDEEKEVKEEDAPDKQAEELPFCEICRYPFKSQKTLNSHLSNRHGINVKTRTQQKDVDTTANTPSSTNDDDKELEEQQATQSDDDSDVEPDVNDLNCFCRKCKLSLGTTIKYRKHLYDKHGFKFKSMTNRRPNTSSKELPDPTDVNLYCRVCDYKYTNYKYFRKHCRIFHKMAVGEKREKLNPNPNILPDIDDKDFYCKSCNTKYKTKRSFRSHIKSIHNIVPPPIKRPHVVNKDIIPDLNNPNFFCDACNIKYAGRTNYMYHLLIVHRMGLKKIEDLDIENDLSLPNPYDENFYCRVCRRKYRDKTDFKRHIRIIHRIDLGLMGRQEVNKEIEPIIDDPNHHCRSCEKTFCGSGSYRTHLRTVHQIEPPKKILPTYPDPFCNYCEIKYTSYAYHHKHMLRFHGEHVLPLEQKK